MKKFIIGLILAMSLSSSAQSPQIPLSPATPVVDINAKYIQGVGIGYAPTVVSGLTLNVGPGTSFCAGSKVTSAGGHVSMAASQVNYVFLNSSTCAVSTSIVNFSGGIPIAEVTTNVSNIVSIVDDRTLFSVSSGLVPILESGTPSGGSCSSANYNQSYYNTATTPYSSYICSSTTNSWVRTNLATTADIAALGTLTNNISGTSLNITAYPLNQSVATGSSPTFASLTFTGAQLDTGLAGCLAISNVGVITNTNTPCNTFSGTLSVSNGGSGASSLTGYVYGNGTSPFTASTTIPYSAISGAPAAGVSSVFSRVGAIVAATGDYSCSQITGASCSGSRRWSCQPGLNGGLNTVSAGTYSNQVVCYNDTGSTVTLTLIKCFADAGSSTCNAQDNLGNNLLSSAITGTNSWAAGSQTENTTILSGGWIVATFIADGVSKQIALEFAGTY